MILYGIAALFVRLLGIGLLIKASIVDIEERKIPNEYVIGALGLGAVANAIILLPSPPTAAVGQNLLVWVIASLLAFGAAFVGLVPGGDAKIFVAGSELLVVVPVGAGLGFETPMVAALGPGLLVVEGLVMALVVTGVVGLGRWLGSIGLTDDERLEVPAGPSIMGGLLVAAFIGATPVLGPVVVFASVVL